MSSCPTCGNRDYLCQQCTMEELEERHGLPSENECSEYWVLADGLWHASSEFDGETHTCLCGTAVDVPIEWGTDNLRYVPDAYDAPVCRECVGDLEDGRTEQLESVTFERASELRADGSGLVPARIDYDDLIGSECPQCGEEMTPGSIRFAGHWWEHQSSNTHPQAGHHQISEMLDAEDDENEDRGVATDGGLEEVYRRETIVATDDGIAVGEDAIPEAGRDD